MEYNYGYPVMEKRAASRPTLSDYLRLAANQYEMDKEEDEAADAQIAGNLKEFLVCFCFCLWVFVLAIIRSLQLLQLVIHFCSQRCLSIVGEMISSLGFQNVD